METHEKYKKDPGRFMDEIKPTLISIMKSKLKAGSLKIDIILNSEFIHSETNETTILPSREKQFNLLNSFDIEEQLDANIESCLTHFAQYTSLNTKYQFHKVLYLDFNVDKYTHLSGAFSGAPS